MTNQHRATPEQWAQIERTAEDIHGDGCCALLELRARIELLEATQHAHLDISRLSETERERIRQELSQPAALQPHQDKMDRLIALDADDDGEPIVMPSVKDSLTVPAGLLVERIGSAAILEVAAAALQMHPDKNLTWERVALWLEQEANR